LDKKENYSFTITVEGAKWENLTYNMYEVGYLVYFPNYTIRVYNEQSGGYYCNFWYAFPVTNWVRTSDTVVTATFKDGYTLSGVMEIEFDHPDSIAFAKTASTLIIGGEFSDTYKANPAKNRIVWE
jgi:hypothetical protein